eukprot:TRINITY_DN3031_c0_g1_i1.p2 TRINITY_DN3031_c0_g1~~TRINITY_DN3031_c0_g1_i1.p2  ORF type:complete len:359 (-),score=82.68 TRINITY_DN3031_c0_g1_i1:45-1121(-)
MSKMLDILEMALNLFNFTYVRLDGSTKTELRSKIVERFNQDKRIFSFIASTRSGGIGLNLTGADCVIFYDTDWNPAMDKQAQDRCHRIGQTKNVQIYRLITEYTIEENILLKSLEKKKLAESIMEEGKFNYDYYKKLNVKDLLGELIMPGFGSTDLSSINMKQFQQALHTVEDRDDIIAGEQLHLEQKDLIQQDQLDNSTNFNNGIDWEKLPTIYAYGKSFVFNEYYEQYGIEKPITQQEQIFVREPLIFQEKDKESNESSDEIDQESEMAEEMDEIQENEKEENEEENAGSNIQKTEKSEQEKEESQEEENFGDQKNIRIFSRQEILQYYKLYQQMQKSVQSAYQFQEQQAAFKVQE